MMAFQSSSTLVQWTLLFIFFATTTKASLSSATTSMVKAIRVYHLATLRFLFLFHSLTHSLTHIVLCSLNTELWNWWVTGSEVGGCGNRRAVWGTKLLGLISLMSTFALGFIKSPPYLTLQVPYSLTVTKTLINIWLKYFFLFSNLNFFYFLKVF